MNLIERIIEGSIRNRLMVILVTLVVVVIGIRSMLTIPVDAIPDLSDVQVIVIADYPGQSPQVVEDQVIYPLTTALLAVPYVKDVRGYSFFNFGMVYLIFEDGTDLYWARSRVLEYLNQAAGRLPSGVTPRLGPDATGLGWIYEYALQSDKHNLADLRSLQDWYLRYELQTVPGVAEVASVGGFVKQYQVSVDPDRLASLGIPLQQVKMALSRSNDDVGGRLLEMGETEYFVRGLGYFRGHTNDEIVQQIEKIALGISPGGHPIQLKQVADVSVGPELRRGIAEWNGEGEVVGGIVVIRSGENALAVIERVKEKLEDLKAGLPEGVKIVPAYDRSGLIMRAIDTLREKLLEEMLVVALITIVFLLHFRSALVAFFTIPAGVLISFIAMKALNINANIMSLGGIAIAIGVMVDASVVMVENAHKHIERDSGKKPHIEIIAEAARGVGPALFFSLLIITVSFFPVFSLQAQEGRLFSPLAYTKTFAMAASAFLAITIIPVLMVLFIRGKIPNEKKNPLSRFFIGIYKPVIKFVLRRPLIVIGASLVILAVTILPYKQLGSEFMPPLNEGDLLYMPTTPPGISPAKAGELLQQTDRIIKSFPEVHHVFGKIGRAETATDPAPLSMIETTIMLKQDQSKWRAGVTIDSLIQELDAAIQIPGLTNAWTMPIRTRIDMLSTGIKTPVGIKIMGDDLDSLARIGEEIEAVVGGIPDVTSVYAERVVGGKYIDIDINRDLIARHGLTVGDVQDVIKSALGGMNVTWTVEGQARYPVNVRYPRERRDSLADIHRVRVPTPGGYTVPLSELAAIDIVDGPPVIKTENARKTLWVYVDTRDSDIGGFVFRLQKEVQAEVKLPTGYSLVWSGQFEYMQRAAQRLRVVVPITLLIIFFLLYLHFRNITESLVVMLSLPFALIGGVWLMYLLDFNMSVAVAVGYIALLGLAAETGVVMLVYLDEAYRRYIKEGRMKYISNLRSAIMEGAVDRVRPKLMTVATTLIGLLPIMFGAGAGSQVMKRIAAPMVGGLVSSTVLTLVILPAIYYFIKLRTVEPDPPKIDSEVTKRNR
ncbi:CusA/CzcA family heavy metal efflux RND transporter [candidate division LCP-89 bacterium B3_LCP]|uniref:CusA/CzcA family heavy metal efflux RND transporter n=1 Tax=candidate division LCP-89 bacterium B3_LCP TaxID=2012998 RepID=A0A532V0L7_UNCL8|nr:MAG: CusA/CzcA family heavy metal efflux RND transporter [candidate division LCP-89 bacterium B3_LCP]